LLKMAIGQTSSTFTSNPSNYDYTQLNINARLNCACQLLHTQMINTFVSQSGRNSLTYQNKLLVITSEIITIFSISKHRSKAYAHLIAKVKT
jgi:hypothetical protein